jgi:hypothetical protein
MDNLDQQAVVSPLVLTSPGLLVPTRKTWEGARARL